MLHLNPRLRFLIVDKILALLHGKALVALLVGFFELQVGGRTRPSQNGDPILEDIALCKWSVAIRLVELVRIEIFSGGLASAHQEQMVSPQRCRVWYRDDAVNNHSPGDAPFRDGSPKRDMLARHVHQNMCKTGANQKEGQNRAGAHKRKEVAVIAPPNTVVEPDAVVIECVDTVVAHPAVVAARRSPDTTGLAVLHGHVHGGHFRSSELDHDPIICRRAKRQRVVSWICRRHSMRVSWHNSRVNNGCVYEGGNADIENVCKDNGDSRRDVVPQPGSRECEEKRRRNDYQKSCSNVDGLVPRVLEPPTATEECVANEIFPVLAQCTSR